MKGGGSGGDEDGSTEAMEDESTPAKGRGSGHDGGKGALNRQR